VPGLLSPIPHEVDAGFTGFAGSTGLNALSCIDKIAGPAAISAGNLITYARKEFQPQYALITAWRANLFRDNKGSHPSSLLAGMMYAAIYPGIITAQYV
jgi:hypothetical protein